MLGSKFIIENAGAVKQNCINRGVIVDIDRFVELEINRKAMQAGVEDLNRQANQVSKITWSKKIKEAEREARKEEGRRLREQIRTRQAELDAVAVELHVIHLAIPNMSHPDAPIIPAPVSGRVKYLRRSL